MKDLIDLYLKINSGSKGAAGQQDGQPRSGPSNILFDSEYRNQPVARALYLLLYIAFVPQTLLTRKTFRSLWHWLTAVLAPKLLTPALASQLFVIDQAALLRAREESEARAAAAAARRQQRDNGPDQQRNNPRENRQDNRPNGGDPSPSLFCTVAAPPPNVEFCPFCGQQAVASPPSVELVTTASASTKKELLLYALPSALLVAALHYYALYPIFMSRGEQGSAVRVLVVNPFVMAQRWLIAPSRKFIHGIFTASAFLWYVSATRWTVGVVRQLFEPNHIRRKIGYITKKFLHERRHPTEIRNLRCLNPNCSVLFCSQCHQEAHYFPVFDEGGGGAGGGLYSNSF